MSHSNQVRDFARRTYIEPAVRKGESICQIVVGDVHRALHLTNRVPLVCSALTSRAFLEDNHLELLKREGPPSGLSTTMKYTYRVANSGSAPKTSSFAGLRGIAKQVFQALGGGEAFLRAEREKFNHSGEDTR